MSPLVGALIWMDMSNFSQLGKWHGTIPAPLNLTTGQPPVWLPNKNTTTVLRGRTSTSQPIPEFWQLPLYHTDKWGGSKIILVSGFGSSHSSSSSSSINIQYVSGKLWKIRTWQLGSDWHSIQPASAQTLPLATPSISQWLWIMIGRVIRVRVSGKHSDCSETITHTSSG